MVGRNVEAACPPPFVRALHPRKRHELMPVAKLNCPESQVGSRQPKQAVKQEAALLGAHEKNGREQVNHQAAQHDKEIIASEVFHWGKLALNDDVAKKKQAC